MTLTSILPTLRASIPDPIDSPYWPVGTHATIADIVVDGVSLTDLARLCSTPCVHIADGGPRGARQGVTFGGDMSIVVTTVAEVFTADDGVPVLVVDAALPAGKAAWKQVRLLGRASRARCTRTTVAVREASGVRVLGDTSLPCDVVVGDLLGVPCAGLLSARDVVVEAGHPAG